MLLLDDKVPDDFLLLIEASFKGPSSAMPLILCPGIYSYDLYLKPNLTPI